MIPVIAAAAGLVVLVPVAAILAGMLVPAFARARTRAEEVRCESQVGALGNLLLVEMGERGKEGGDPVPWTVVTNVATVPALYRCPGDRRRPEPGDLAGAVEGSSYEFLPDDLVRMPGGRVLVYCPIHGHGVLEDGSVHKLRSPAGDAGR